MAPKRQSAKENPPPPAPSSSSSESEEIESESESEPEPIDKKTTTHVKKTDSNPNPVPSSAQPASSSESGSGSDSGSESPPPEHQLQPISPNATEKSPNSKLPKPKTSTPDSDTPAKPVSSPKRQIDSEVKKPRSKRQKKNSSESGGEENNGADTSIPNGKASKNPKESEAKAKELPEKDVNLGDTNGIIEDALFNSKCLSESRKGLVGLKARNVKNGLEWHGSEKCSELEEKRRKLRAKVVELYLERIALVEETVKAASEAQ